jgi:O-antigen/teichoic acid export membrane protein
MTNNDARDAGWGERNVERRNRRRWALAGAGVATSIVFGLAGPYVVSVGKFIAPVGEAADTGSLLWSVCLLAAAAILFRLIWREIDEVQRRRLINAAAVAGIASMVLLLLAQAAGRMLPFAEPMMAIFVGAATALIAAIIFQRIRG